MFYNLEATPAEGTSYRLASKDKEKYPDIITAGTDAPIVIQIFKSITRGIYCVMIF